MGRFSRVLALPFALLVTLVGIAPTATVAVSVPELAAVSAPTPSAQRLLVTGWHMYQNGFVSSGTCESQRQRLHGIYADYWHSSRCTRYAIPSCGATTYKYQIDVRSYYGENGPLRAAPLATADHSAVVAAC